MKAIIHGRIVAENEILRGQVLLYDEQIRRIIPEAEFDPASAAEIFDAAGQYVSPGFINMHIHGCCGVDVMDDEDGALEIMCRAMAATGVTAFLPTTMTYDIPRINRSLQRIRQGMQSTAGSRILGAHVEGPFINATYKGAQAAQNIMTADFSLLAPYREVVKVITLAPECLSDLDFIRLCRDCGMIVSLGHSAANYEQAAAAFAAGASHVTHMFNAMGPLHHRNPGLLGAAMTLPVSCEIIADNIHVHPIVQQLVYRAKNRRDIILITDSMRACLLPDGESELGGQKVLVKNGKATLADGTIAGSVLTMNQAVKNFKDNTGASLAETVAMASANPARELGLPAGAIVPGKWADLVIFDKDITICRTIVNGQVVYDRLADGGLESLL